MKICLAIIILFFSYILQAQDYPINQHINDLATDDQEQSFRLNNLYTKFRKYDSNTQGNLIRIIENRVRQEKNKFLEVRFSFFKLFLLRFFMDASDTQPVKTEFRRSLAMAKDLKNEILLADGCYWYSILLNEHQQVAEALFYNLKSIELMEKLGSEKFYGVSHRYTILGELLYHTREYEKSIEYSKKALYHKVDNSKHIQRVLTLNNIGLAYQKLHQSDSAIFYFDKSSKLAATQNNEVWVTIPNANKAQIWFTQKKYKEAFPLFEADYNASAKMGDYPNAANNLQWMAKICLAENKTDSALKKAIQARQMLRPYPNGGAIANTYQTLAAIYQHQNKTDSSNHYLLLYNNIHDSTEAAVATSRSEIVQLRLDYERNKTKIEILQENQQTEKINRNIFVGFVVLVSLIVYLSYSHQHIKQKKQHQSKEAELKAANEQMALFTKTIAENLQLIDNLQQQIKQHNLDPAVKQNLEILKQKTILTEDDWEVFQNIFEKIYSGFFERLRKINPNITSAELRFASIIRLQMNNKQAGAMLGISPDSARKTRLRLRQRLNITEELSLEQVVQSL
jgi:tetratricopeptide (TPR) repeat protein